MGVLDNFDFDAVQELHILEEGEYELKVVEAGEYVSRSSGKTSIRVVFEPVEDSASEYIYHYFSLPAYGDDARTEQGKLRRMNDFFFAFNIQNSSRKFPNEWAGATGWALVGIRETEGFDPSNTITRFIIPKSHSK